MSRSSIHRFTDSVDYYMRYRPGYPRELLAFMTRELGLKPSDRIADIGSGTGKLTELFLGNGNVVYAVEPNDAMRSGAEHLFGGRSNFISVDGTAERMGLPEHSVHFLTAGHAFHWFDIPSFREECIRVLKPGGPVLLIWNDREDEKTAFLGAFEQFLVEYSTDYPHIDLRRTGREQFEAFFGAGNYQYRDFTMRQHFDLEGLWGRYQSCSYALPAHHPRFADARDALRALYKRHSSREEVIMWYKTKVYYGRLSESSGM